MVKNMKELISRAEELDWTIEEVDGEYQFQRYSPEGHDFHMYIKGKTAEELIVNIYEYYEDYDVSEEASCWVDHTGHGTNGAPYELEDLVEDFKACKNMILDLYNELKGVAKEVVNIDYHLESKLATISHKFQELEQELLALEIDGCGKVWDLLCKQYIGHPLTNIDEFIDDSKA